MDLNYTGRFKSTIHCKVQFASSKQHGCQLLRFFIVNTKLVYIYMYVCVQSKPINIMMYTVMTRRFPSMLLNSGECINNCITLK